MVSSKIAFLHIPPHGFPPQNFKIVLAEIGYGSLDWIQEAQDTVQ
jgi:hypothetical protein